MAKRARGGCPQRGRRHSAELKADAVAWAAEHGTAAAAVKFGCSGRSVLKWMAARARSKAAARKVSAATRMAAPSEEKSPVKWGTAARPEHVTTVVANSPSSVTAAKAAARKAQGASQAGRGAAATRSAAVTKPAPSAEKEPVPASAPKPSHGRNGRRYGVAEKDEALVAAAQLGIVAAAEKLGISRWSLYEWRRRAAQAKTPEQTAAALEPRSSRAKRNANKLDEERYHLIADTWLKNQALGPRQVRNLLRRSHGLRAATSTVRKVMEEHGYVPPKITVEQKEARRYEAVRPLQQVHLDFLHFFVHKAKVYLLLIEDDHSRWILGWTLCEGERAKPVIETVDAAVARHGKPETMVVDGGSGFFSWKGQSQLERVCADYGIDFIKAGKAGGNAKLEALNGTVRRELLSRVEFGDLDEARRKIAEYIRFYNHERPHEGLGGLLVPADRFFGRVDEVMAQLERGDPVVVPGMGLETRPLDLFRVISRGGRPELWLLGHRIWPVEATSPTGAAR